MSKESQEDLPRECQSQEEAEALPTPSKPKRLVIAAACRSGTKYMAELLNRCGVDAKHETAYGEKGIRGVWHQAEVSCWVPHYYVKDEQDVVVHQVRNPIDAINSNAAHWEHSLNDIFYPSARDLSTQADHQRFPKLARYPTPVTKALASYVWCNQVIENLTDERYRVEDISYELVAGLLSQIDVSLEREKFDEAYMAVPKNANPLPTYCNRGLYNYTFHELPEIPEKEELGNMLARYGYV